jgi:hypothetical protein
MRRLVNTILLLIVILPLAAQAPDWTNAASRKMHYPSDTYYTGYIEGKRQSGESLEDAMSQLKDAARVELASTIRTSVEQTLDSRTQSDMQQSGSFFDEQIRETFVSETRITSSIKDIPGLKIEAYNNSKTNEICAFAYVKRSTLINHLVKRIALLSGKTENDLEQAQEMAGSGQKSQARNVIERGLQNLAQVEEAQNLLAAVDETTDEEMLQIEPTRTLYRQLTSLREQLRNALSIYLQCEAKLFDGDYRTLKGAIEGALSEAEVSFVNDPEEADWAVYIHAEAQEHAKKDFGNMSNYAAFVEAHMDIDRKSNGKRVYSSGLTSDIANHTRGFEPAAREAYKNITPNIIEILKKQINL